MNVVVAKQLLWRNKEDIETGLYLNQSLSCKAVVRILFWPMDNLFEKMIRRTTLC